VARAASGFNKDTLRFLEELEANNERAWFEANKARYEQDVLDVALHFIAAMQAPLGKLAPHFTAVPTRVGGSLMRIYRDTRFAADKSPYKTNIGIQFRHEQAKDVHSPGYYVHIHPREVFVAVGMWRPDAESLRRIRERIVAKPDEWRRAVNGSRFRRRFELEGERLVRPPRGFDGNHPLIDDIRRKSFIAVRDFEVEDCLAPAFLKRVTETIGAGEPLMRFLCKAVGVSF